MNAGAASVCINDDLSAQGNGRGFLLAHVDVESINERRGRVVSPVRAAVLRNVLVLVPGEVGDAVHISPVDDSGQVVLLVKVPAVRGVLHLALREGGLLDVSGSAVGRRGCVLVAVGVERGLREVEDVEVVLGVLELVVRGDMPGFLGLGVLEGGPGAVGLDGDVVGAAAQAVKAVLAPVLTLEVADEPVLQAVLLALANEGNVLDNLHVTDLAAKDAAGVLLEEPRGRPRRKQ